MPTNAPKPVSNRLILTGLLAYLTASIPIYIALTFAAPWRRPPQLQPAIPPAAVTALAAASIVVALIALAAETAIARRAIGPAAVQFAALLSAVLGELPGLCGLFIYFANGERIWLFFAVSGLYYAGLWARLPGLLRRMDELSRPS